MEVFTEEWASACCEALNRGGAYAVAAADWEEGVSVLSMAADPAHGIMEDRAVYIDAHRGHCRGARMATEADIEAAPYVFRADAVTWKRLLAGEVEPVTAVMQGKLKLVRGSLFALAKHAKAATAMVAAAGEVGGTFPASSGDAAASSADADAAEEDDDGN
jgi:putative sterol carrier protein